MNDKKINFDEEMQDKDTIDTTENPENKASKKMKKDLFQSMKDNLINSIIKDENKSQALQYGKPSKNDPRKTPADPSERKRGSKKNPPESASKPNKNIKQGKNTTNTLSAMMKDHNSKVEKNNKGFKVNMGQLKSVQRRGEGAFSTSHHPSMDRRGWGIARVKAFLYLMYNGRPSNPNYKQDNDLLPKNHPKASQSKADEASDIIEDSIEMAMSAIKSSLTNIQRLVNSLQSEDKQMSVAEPWVQAKLTLIDDYLKAITDYVVNFEPEETEDEEDEEENEDEKEEENGTEYVQAVK